MVKRGGRGGCEFYDGEVMAALVCGEEQGGEQGGRGEWTINLIHISSKWLIPSFGVCSWWINSSSKRFHIFFSGVQIFSAISSEPPSKSPQGLNLILFIQFYLFILLLIGGLHGRSSWFNSFFQVFIKILIGGAQVSFLASRSANNSSFSSEVEFCISSFFSAIQTFACGRVSPQVLRCFSLGPQQADSFVVDFLNNSVQSFLLSSFHSILSILPEALCCSSHQVSSHLMKFMFYSFYF